MDDIEYTLLPGTDLRVSRMAVGCEQLGGTDWGAVDVEAAEVAVQTAFDLGINLYDTADVYGLGLSEERLARALGRHRHDVVIATKFGINWTAGSGNGRAKTFRDCQPTRVEQALEASLHRLQLDCIPLYQIHWPDPNVPIVETMAALERCRRKGKIRYIGCSNLTLQQLDEARSVGPVVAAQTSYNLVDRSCESQLLPYCSRHSIGVLAYGPLAQGLLTGEYGLEARFPQTDRRHRLPAFQEANRYRNWCIVERVIKLAEQLGQSPAQVALRWLLDQPHVSSVIVGVKRAAQLKENVGAFDFRLDPTSSALLTAVKPAA